MKRLNFAFLAFLALVFFSCASAPVSYPLDEEIIPIAGKTKNELFDAANKWAVQTFRKADCVLEYSNANTGTISGKYVYNLNHLTLSAKYTTCRCLITVECKDSKVRLSMQPLEVYSTNASGGLVAIPGWVSITSDSKAGIDKTYPAELESIKKSLTQYLTNSNSDW